MKLLFCPDCADVVKLLSTFRACRCRAVEGRYVDDETVEVTGERAEVIGLDGHSITAALALAGSSVVRGPEVRAWMFRHGYEHVRRLGRKR